MLVVGRDDLVRDQRLVGDAGVVEDTGDRVVVLDRDRIKFVIVAARTGHGQPEERPRECVHPVAQRLRLGGGGCLGVTAIAVVRGANGEETGPGAGRQRGVRGQFTGDLPAHKLVERHVFVEGVHDEVTVLPRVGQAAVVEESAESVAVPGDVHPVSRPAFAVLWRSEQLLDDLIPTRVTGNKRSHLLGCRRQADKVKISAPNQRPPIRFR